MADQPQKETNSRVTTTHAAWGAGNPRLLVSRDDQRFVFDIEGDETRIGSAADNELRLEDLDVLHARIQHDDRDEYVLTLLGSGESELPAESSDRGEPTVLRTGARFMLGPWTVVYQRDEYADHGRPYGGREGGEGDVQYTQPPRPDYRRERGAS
ncbi:FHA domain-containing protein [Humibacter ginsenosidimutans]|uniref:FHA domain-containing protein n=1 Tax=Humibacter ginsenosidimutans TaxID=2599293 RepID=A0A5B8M5C2_9MICO|nr:FHA domain-containing protein [Humibacter ginsenosidimutans]QDZ15154.1 FHA domain-containing protein [Humibacter ginsenosidimutans]